MKVETQIKFDKSAFERIKRNVKFRAEALRERKKNPQYSTFLPDDIGLQINRNCNLRCETCFLWNDQGRYTNLSKQETSPELDVRIFEKILAETHSVKSNLFIWGTEPLLHSQWDEYAKCLEKDPRWLVICTNGILINKKIDSLLPISENTVLDVSLDGLEDVHDEIRGKGRFKKTMNNVKMVLDLQQSGEYKGLVSLHCVVTEPLIPQLYQLVEYANSLEGIDTLYLGLPWYISPETATEMDEYFAQRIPISLKTEGKKPSWWQYTYNVSGELVEALRKELVRLETRKWDIRIRIQPNIGHDTLEDFILGGKVPADNKKHCLAISNRMDVLATGDVTSCQPYPEFVVGNLYQQSLQEVWKGKVYDQVRAEIDKGLTPICSKCILLYLNGA
jgi:sulfatase maturation enzyme AslB (radical SAM superfamily)